MYRLCSKNNYTSSVVEGDYVISDLQVDRYRKIVEANNAGQKVVHFYLEKEPEKLPRTRRPSATMSRKKE